MGVKGLLVMLKSIQRHTTLRAYAGQTLGVDTFGWLHRGAVACADKLANDTPTHLYVDYVVSRVRMLLDFGITPYMIFDGDSVPSKAGTNADRRKEREAAKELGKALLRAGKVKQAEAEWQKAVTVTPQMTFEVIKAMRRMNVQILVAPYEADAQLAYLEREGIIDGILSEDSDLLVFGAKKLITKLDKHGSCIEINRKDLILNTDASFAGWSDTMFRRMAILSGCDYLPNIGKMGLKTAHDYVKKYKEISKITRMMAMSGKFVVPSDYIDKFTDAERAFLYHRVFCPKAGTLVLLNTLPPHIREEDMPQIGNYVQPDLALGVACGDLNPKTKERFTTAMPPPNAPRQQSTNTANNLKPRQSLDSFFRPQRTPLAELDPNSLTPSPSQRRILENNRNASWEPRLVDAAPRSAPSLRRAVTDTPVSHTRSAFLARASATSTYKPAKRPRLCSESDEVSPSKEIKQSKFFSSATAEQSPLASKKSRDRKKSKPFDVFSDDAAEAIMLNLEQHGEKIEKEVKYPDLPPLPKQEASQVEEDLDVVPQSSPGRTQAVAIDSQSSHGTAELNEMSLQSQADTTPEAIHEVSAAETPDAFRSLLDRHVHEHNRKVHPRRSSRTFFDRSPEQQVAALATLQSNVEFDAVSANEVVNEDPEAEEVQSPARPAGRRFASLAKTFSCQASDLQARALQSMGRASRSSESITVTATAVVENKGSEDNLPLSSPTAEEVSDVDDKAVKLLDLKQFRYQALR